MKISDGKKDGSGIGKGRGFCREFGGGCGQGVGRQERLRRCQARQAEGNFSLAELEEDKRARIVVNPDEQTVGMGLFSGQIVKMSKNDAGQDKLVVCVGESRLVIPKATAKLIVVR